jgi:hypothetical protein
MGSCGPVGRTPVAIGGFAAGICVRVILDGVVDVVRSR